ncbi:hypothetical protein QQG55_1165 [Brugia pahangi]
MKSTDNFDKHSPKFWMIIIMYVRFVPLDIEDDESISDLLLLIDNTIQHGEDLEVKDRYPEEVDDNNTIY